MKLNVNSQEVIPFVVSSPLAYAGEFIFYIVCASGGLVATHFLGRWLNKKWPK